MFLTSLVSSPRRPLLALQKENRSPAYQLSLSLYGARSLNSAGRLEHPQTDSARYFIFERHRKLFSTRYQIIPPFQKLQQNTREKHSWNAQRLTHLCDFYHPKPTASNVMAWLVHGRNFYRAQKGGNFSPDVSTVLLYELRRTYRFRSPPCFMASSKTR